MALYNNTNNRHSMHTLMHRMLGKNSLEIIIKKVCLEGGFKRGGRIRVVECLGQIVPNRWVSVKKKIFHQMFLCLLTHMHLGLNVLNENLDKLSFFRLELEKP